MGARLASELGGSSSGAQLALPLDSAPPLAGATLAAGGGDGDVLCAPVAAPGDAGACLAKALPSYYQPFAGLSGGPALSGSSDGDAASTGPVIAIASGGDTVDLHTPPQFACMRRLLPGRWLARTALKQQLQRCSHRYVHELLDSSAQGSVLLAGALCCVVGRRRSRGTRGLAPSCCLLQVWAT